MQNNSETTLNILLNDKTIAETLNKILSGQYVSRKERKEGMKAVVDRWADIEKSCVTSEQDKQNIEAQAIVIKAWVENLKEGNN